MQDIAPAVFPECNAITLHEGNMLGAVRPGAADEPSTAQPWVDEGAELSVDCEHIASQATTSVHCGIIAPLAAALVLHLAAGLAMLGFTDVQIGSGGTDLDAISIEVSMVPASALELSEIGRGPGCFWCRLDGHRRWCTGRPTCAGGRGSGCPRRFARRAVARSPGSPDANSTGTPGAAERRQSAAGRAI